MYSLILVVTFTPFMWGDSSTTVKEIEGFESEYLCVKASHKYMIPEKTNEGYTTYKTNCLLKGQTK